MAFVYTQADLQERMSAGVQGKLGILGSPQNTMNAAVRTLFRDTDLRSAKRRATLAPNLFNGIFNYQCPSDLKGQSIIDIPGQAKRSDGEWMLVPSEEFDRLGGKKAGLIAIDDYNASRVLKLSSAVDSKSLLISALDSTVAGGGTWAAFGDGTNLAADTDDFVEQNGSLKWDISAAGGTTAGIANATLNSFDLSDYLGGTSAFFVWAKINSITDLTNYIIRFGNSASVYYSKTVTAQADGTAFVAGWNLLKFDISSLAETGSVDDTAIDYVALYMTKAAGKISETDYKFDNLVLKRGVVHYVKYYTKYGWQSSAAAYKENSTASTDLLVADTDEFELIVESAIIEAMKEIGYPEGEIRSRKQDLKDAVGAYLIKHPSEAKIIMYDYYDFI